MHRASQAKIKVSADPESSSGQCITMHPWVGQTRNLGGHPELSLSHSFIFIMISDIWHYFYLLTFGFTFALPLLSICYHSDIKCFRSGTSGKESCQCRRYKRLRFHPWVGKTPWRRAWQATSIFLPVESHEQKEEPGGLRSKGLKRVRHYWSNLAHTHWC